MARSITQITVLCNNGIVFPETNKNKIENSMFSYIRCFIVKMSYFTIVNRLLGPKITHSGFGRSTPPFRLSADGTSHLRTRPYRVGQKRTVPQITASTAREKSRQTCNWLLLMILMQPER